MKKLTEQEIENHFYENQRALYPDYSIEEIEIVKFSILEDLKDQSIKDFFELNAFFDKKFEEYFYQASEQYHNRLHFPTEFPYKILFLWLEEISRLEEALESGDLEKIVIYKLKSSQKLNTIQDILYKYYDNSDGRTALEQAYFSQRVLKYIERYQKAIGAQ